MANQVSRRSFVKGGLAASALAALSACGKKQPAASDAGSSSAAGSAAAAGGTFKYYINNPVAIDPYNTQEDQGTKVEYMLFDALTDYDWEAGKIVPKAAESWDVSDDGLTYTFHLVKGAKFHNGDPVDAESFKRGWQRLCDQNMATPSEIGYHLNPVKGAVEMGKGEADEIVGLTCPDENTFVVELTAPMADFPYVCAHPALAPVPQAALDDPEKFLVAPIGNGPFKMDGEWKADQYINVVRFDDYYGEKAKLDGVNFSIQKDPDTAFREFEAGNMDFAQIPTGRLEELKSSKGVAEDGYTVTPGKQVLTGAETSVYYLVVNMEDPVMSQLPVRQAISLAIDRQKICDSLFEGSRQPADNFFPAVLDPGQDNAWEYCKYDPEAAKKIVDDNNLAGTKITLSCNSGGGHEDIMAMIQENLKAVGFEVEISTMEWAAYLTALGDGQFQIGRLGWIADYPTLDNFLYPNFFSTAENNYSKYNDPEVDKALEDARQINDDDERKAKEREINQTIGEQLPAIPVMFYSHNYVGSDRVQELYFDPQGKAYLHEASLKA
jgi:peptide/nickel transport system substrate-binding protein/oligopeptide transport system substrate-binding protein